MVIETSGRALCSSCLWAWRPCLVAQIFYWRNEKLIAGQWARRWNRLIWLGRGQAARARGLFQELSTILSMSAYFTSYTTSWSHNHSGCARESLTSMVMLQSNAAHGDSKFETQVTRIVPNNAHIQTRPNLECKAANFNEWKAELAADPTCEQRRWMSPRHRVHSL